MLKWFLIGAAVLAAIIGVMALLTWLYDNYPEAKWWTAAIIAFCICAAAVGYICKEVYLIVVGGA